MVEPTTGDDARSAWDALSEDARNEFLNKLQREKGGGNINHTNRLDYEQGRREVGSDFAGSPDGKKREREVEVITAKKRARKSGDRPGKAEAEDQEEGDNRHHFL